MKVEITVPCLNNEKLGLKIRNDDNVEYVWVSVEPTEQEGCVCVDIDILKLALRKISAK